MPDKMDNKLEHLVQSLKEAKPKLSQPENLTDSIMDRIGLLPAKRTPTVLLWTRAALSTAAALLFGLFLLQQTEAKQNPIASSSSKVVVKTSTEMDTTCLQQLGNEHLNYLKTYLCYLQQNVLENKQFKTYPLQKN